MQDTAERIWKIKDQLADPRRWVKEALYDSTEDGQLHETDHRACLLGASLDTVIDRQTMLDTTQYPDGDVPTQWHEDPMVNGDAVNADPVNIAIFEAIREQFSERVMAARSGSINGEKVRLPYDQPWEGIPCFNDHDDTTHADIMLVLTKAAIKADEILG
jgi:hypothetical protein